MISTAKADQGSSRSSLTRPLANQGARPNHHHLTLHKSRQPQTCKPPRYPYLAVGYILINSLLCIVRNELEPFQV